MRLKEAQHSDARAGRQRVPAHGAAEEYASLVVAEGVGRAARDFHQLFRSDHRTARHAAADDLPEGSQVRADTGECLRTTVANAEAAYNFVEHERDVELGTQRPHGL